MTDSEQYVLKRVPGRGALVVTDPIETYVDYTPPASREVFQAEFKLRVSRTLFDGRPLIKHKLCQGMNEVSGTRKMIVARLNPMGRQYPNIVNMVRMHFGARPATALEARAFAKEHPRAFTNELVDSLHAVGDFIVDAERDWQSCIWIQGMNEGDELLHLGVFLDRMHDLSDSGSYFLFVLPN